jgi:hypothetical protein
MTGIEFRVPRNDHHTVDDFLARRPEGVNGIQVEVTNVDRHADLAAHAAELGLTVTVDPLTERLCHAGFNPERLPLGEVYPLDPAALSESAAQRATLTEQLISAQKIATALIPGQFFIETTADLDLNLLLVRQMAALDDRPLRPVIAISSKVFTPSAAASLAQAYAGAGVTTVELRVSPLGGQDEGSRKIRKVLAAIAQFHRHGISVSLAMSGIIGHTALALGLVDAFSVGVGYREQYNHKDAINRQIALDADDDGGEEDEEDDAKKGPRGAIAGIYLPALDLTVPRKTARQLYEETTIRRHLGCRIGPCANSLNGPLLDPRGHYLHALAHAVSQTLERPAPWRPTLLRDRLVRAQEVRTQVYAVMPEDIARPKARTVAALIDEIDRSTGHAKSA